MTRKSRADSPDQARYALVLAAGKGTRLKSEKPKVLHELCGKPLIRHMLDKLADLNVRKTFVILGHEAESVWQALPGHDAEIIIQEQQLGTGHAVMTAAPRLQEISGNLLVIYGDTPLLSTETLRRLFEAQEREDADEVLLTAEYENPFGYGRIIRNSQGEPVATIEEKDATPEQRKMQEVNTGSYCFKIDSLLAGLPELTNENQSGEYYITDMLEILRRQGKRVVAVSAESPQETHGINTRAELAEAESHLRRKIAERWMLEGVTMPDPSTVYIDDTVTIGPETTIYPGVVIEGTTQIGAGCKIFAFSHLSNAILEEGVTIDHCSVVRDSRVGKNSTVGPFAHLRQNSDVGEENRIGNFVEMKNSSTGKDTKAVHLSYLGDAELGESVNIGAGTITCNYDGVNKNKTIIKDGAFIGSDSQLIAPVTVGKDSYVAAGSSITEDIPDQALGIARARQINKKDWAKQRKSKKA
ncbi:MAG: bifunctional UDP-N-acetylglucosamine diphosphorylase/glucosamine-1-phosphate N-acetyltransferase GlmU [Acidobacteriota bacterium]